jgi:putative peptidoglycan lipid II flippase
MADSRGWEPGSRFMPDEADLNDTLPPGDLLPPDVPAQEDPVPAQAPVEEAPARHGIGLVALAIMGVHLLARFGGLIQKMVLARFFGTSAVGDAAVAVEKVFQAIYYIPEELLTHSLLPVFNRVRKAGEGEQAAWRVASLAGTLQTILLVLATIVGMVGTEWLCGAILGQPDPGKQKDVDKFNLAVQMVRVAMLGLFCTSLGSLTYVILNAYKRFVTPALGDVAQKAGIILGIVVMSVGFGRENPMGYAVGFILGGIFKILTHLVALGPKLKLVRPGFDFRNPALRELGLLMLPLLAGSLIGKARDLIELRIAWEASTIVTGTAASLDFARKIVWMPVNTLPYALGIALFPFLADWALRREREQVTKAFLTCSRMMIFLFAPITLACLLLGPQVVTVLYKSGKFDAASVLLTTKAFDVYAAGMVFYALEIIALQVYYAHRDTRTPFWIGLGASTLQLTIAWLLGLRLGLGNVGIATGFAIAKTLKVGVMWYWLRPRLTGFDWPSLRRMIGQTLVACAAMGVVVAGLRFAALHVLDPTRKLHALALLVAAAVVGLAVFLGVAQALGMEELRPLVSKLRQRLGRG